jgi:hypothetical protein
MSIYCRIRWLTRILGYLRSHPRIGAQMAMQIGQGMPDNENHIGVGQPIWQHLDRWPWRWWWRLADFCDAYEHGRDLPMDDPLPLGPVDDTALWGAAPYRSETIAHDVSLAQIAHVLWLEITGTVPWRLEQWCDRDLALLLSSYQHFTMSRNVRGVLYYVVTPGSRDRETENILGDPRAGYGFMVREPEQQKRLIGDTPARTAQRLSEWFHDYLWHRPAEFDSVAFHRSHPMLADRFHRYQVPPFGNVYLALSGCGSASCLFMDLMRSVNIPVRKVQTIIDTVRRESHSGLVFDWKAPNSGGRYLHHTDCLYSNERSLQDPAMAPPNSERGIALWEHVWLRPEMFESFFSPDADDHYFAAAVGNQFERYTTTADWMMAAVHAVRFTRQRDRNACISWLRSYGLSDQEAATCWSRVDTSVRAYGEGDLERGFQRLLDGSGSRHEQWLRRTGRIDHLD